MRIQIIKPTADEGYDQAVQMLLTLIISQLSDSYLVVPNRAQIIADLCSGFKDLVDSSHVVVSPTEDEKDMVGKFVSIDKDRIELPDRLRDFLDDKFLKGVTGGTQSNTE